MDTPRGAPPHGDFNYETSAGAAYATTRRPDPRIEAAVHAALGPARTVVNVGAGAGSYEPTDRHVIAIEPSPTMRAQRPRHLAPAVIACAEALPLDDGAVEAAMATVTVHQWSDAQAGVRELRRVARGAVVILTFDGAALDRLWLAEYAPELMAAERRRYPSITDLVAWLGGPECVDVHPVLVPRDCADGFTEAFYARPAAFLDARVRAGQSAWGFVEPDAVDRCIARLRADLASGAWTARHGHFLAMDTFEGALRLVVARPPAESVELSGPES